MWQRVALIVAGIVIAWIAFVVLVGPWLLNATKTMQSG